MAETQLKALVVGTGFGCRIQVPALRGAGFEVIGLVGADAARTVERAAYPRAEIGLFDVRGNQAPRASSDGNAALSGPGSDSGIEEPG